MKFVTADSSPDGMAASSSQRRRRRQSIGRSDASPAARRHLRCHGRLAVDAHAGFERQGRRMPVRAPSRPQRRHDARRGDGQHDHQRGVADRPQPALGGQAEPWLDDRRVGQQRQQRAAVAQARRASTDRPCRSERAVANQPDTSGVVVVSTNAGRSDDDDEDAQEVHDRRDLLDPQVGDPDGREQQRAERQPGQRPGARSGPSGPAGSPTRGRTGSRPAGPPGRRTGPSPTPRACRQRRGAPAARRAAPR